MSVLTNMIKEMRERKLWPIAIGLIVALVAVPVLLSKHAATNLVTPQLAGGVPYSTGTSLPAISVQTTPGASKLAGRGRDPFTPQHVATTATAVAVTPATVASLPSTGAVAGAGSGSAGNGGVGNGGAVTPSVGGGSSSPAPAASSPAPTPNSPAPAPSTPRAAAKPAPAGLSATQSYRVSLALTNSGGGLDTIDPLERLSVLPSPQHPLLVELGVLEGAHQVLFAVEPGAAVSGPASCTPGPIDCEIIALSPGQTEAVSKQTASGTTPVALFSVNSIGVDQHPSRAAAQNARRTASEAGRKLVASSPLSAVSLFQYDPSVGAVVDLRNLTVGGS